MPRLRALLVALGLVAVGLVVGVLAAVVGPAVGAADAATASLIPDSQDIRAGATITMTGTFCGTGSSITGIEVAHEQPYPKAPIMTFPLDPTAAGLVQSPTGFTFSYTMPGDRLFLWFTVRCSDGSSASSRDAKVTVWPPYGELWFINPYPTPTYGTAGETIEAVVHSIDCVEGSTAQAALRHGGTTVATASGVFTDHWLYASVPVPAGTPAGEDYSLRVACTGTDGGTITDDHPAVIAAGSGGPTTTVDGSIPATGAAPGGLVWLATVSTMVGALLLTMSRRRPRSAATTG